MDTSKRLEDLEKQIKLTNAPPSISSTKDYDRFVFHPCNRSLTSDGKEKHRNHKLHQSMQRWGFIPVLAVRTFRLKKNKLLLWEGHHRVVAAKELNIVIWYIEDDLPTGLNLKDLMDTEDPTTPWRPRDYVHGRKESGSKDHALLEQDEKTYKVPMIIAAGLGMGVPLNCKASQIARTGQFVYSQSPQHVRLREFIYDIITICRSYDFKAASSVPFVDAVRSAILLEGVDRQHLKRNILKYPERLQPQFNKEAYIRLLDDIYNHQIRSKAKRVDLYLLYYQKERKK